MNPASPFIRPERERPGPDRDDQIDQTLDRLVRVGGVGRSRELTAYVEVQLRRLDDRARAVLDERMTSRSMALLAAVWERGWHPADVVHVLGRADRRAGELASAVISEQARRTGAVARAPQEWADQLARADADATATGLGAGTGRWRVSASQVATGRGLPDAWTVTAVLVGSLGRLPALPRLIPPPSAWSRSSRPAPSARPVGPGDADRDRLLVKIRALLAKAEATEYTAEAEAFTAKAQDLMSRHAIDLALVQSAASSDVAVCGRRVHLDSPYLLEKAQLLTVVGQANRAKVVTFDSLGLAVVVGTPVDVDQIELLFTSLLVQATRSMTEAGTGRAGQANRSSAFRRAFLVSYAHRIGQRLTQADEVVRASYGSALVPVLDRQHRAVETEFERLFPRVQARRSSSYDLRGWDAGRQAADQAVFTAGRLTA